MLVRGSPTLSGSYMNYFKTVQEQSSLCHPAIHCKPERWVHDTADIGKRSRIAAEVESDCPEVPIDVPKYLSAPGQGVCHCRR